MLLGYTIMDEEKAIRLAEQLNTEEEKGGSEAMIVYCDICGGTVEILAGVCEAARIGCDSRGDCPYNKTGPEADKAFQAEAERIYGQAY